MFFRLAEAVEPLHGSPVFRLAEQIKCPHRFLAVVLYRETVKVVGEKRVRGSDGKVKIALVEIVAGGKHHVPVRSVGECEGTVGREPPAPCAGKCECGDIS